MVKTVLFAMDVLKMDYTDISHLNLASAPPQIAATSISSGRTQIVAFSTPFPVLIEL